MLERTKKEQTTNVIKLPTKRALTYNTSELLRKEVLTKQEACWLANVSRATWDRYAKEKERGNLSFQDFPATYKPNGKKTGRSQYKTSEVVNWINSWRKR